ncbi:signal transduction histidine kinase/CheY-like chemotaxis protein/HPt (histidine-containing phosphotransfer) domain-containing protein [Clostridiales Family XIII bacterium PM5-7]
MKKGDLFRMCVCILMATIAGLVTYYVDSVDGTIILVIPIVYYTYKRGYSAGVFSGIPILAYLIFYHFFEQRMSVVNISAFLISVLGFGIIIGLTGHLHAKFNQKMEEHIRSTETLAEILDFLDEQIMICELDTNEILFANAYTREIHNLPDDYLGKKCYEAFYGLSERCDFCKFDSEDDGKRHYWEHYNSDRHRWFQDINTVVNWMDGHKVCLQQSIDITNARIEENRLNRRIALQDTLNDIAMKCIAFDDLKVLAEETLEMLAKSVGFDRVTLVQLIDDEEETYQGNCIILGCYDQRIPVLAPYEDTQYISLYRFYEFYKEHDTRFALSEDFPEDYVLQTIDGNDVKDFCVTAIHSNGKLAGFVIAMNYDGPVPTDNDTLFACEMYTRLLNDAIIRSGAQRTIEESMARLVGMINAMPMTSVFYDADCHPVFCNEHATVFAGVSSQEEYLERYHELMPEVQPNGRNSREWSAELILDTFKTGKMQTMEWVHRNVNGKEIPTEVTLVRINWSDGTHRVVSYVRSLEEIRAQMKALEETHQMLTIAKEEAEKSANAKSEFLARMSHEIRTPLNAIFSMSHLLSIAEQDPIKQGYLQNVLLASDSLLHIINDILDFSKIDANKMELIEADYNLYECIIDAIKLNTIKGNVKNITFMTRIPSTLPKQFKGDENKILQILSNFLSNAIKYTQEGTICLAVDFQMEGELCNLRLSVEDTGMGIAKEDLDKLHLAFYQADVQKNRNIQGTGLGLSICKGLAEIIGGNIEIESEYGVGSTFSLVLPQTVVDASPIIDKVESEGKHVLVIGTGPAAQNLAEKLRDIGVTYEMVDCKNASESELRKKQFTHIFYRHENCTLLPTWAKEQAEHVCVTMIKDFSDISDDYMTKRINILFMPIVLSEIVQIINTGTVGVRATLSGTEKRDAFIYEKVKALIVDDNDTNCLVATELLKKYGIRSEVAISGELAIDMVNEAEYDIIFMDHMMPGMDGVEATAIIRTLKDWTKGVPIVALTANALVGMREFFLDNQFDEFLSKPILIEELEQVLLKWLPKEKRKTLDEITVSDSWGEEAEEILQALEGSQQLRAIEAKERMNISTEAYVRILDSVYRSIPNYIDRLQRMNGVNGDMREFQIAAHAQKGALANVGANDLSAQAKTLEKAAEIGDAAVIREVLPKYIDLLEQFYQWFSQMLQSNGTPEDEEPKPKKNISKVRTALLEIRDLVIKLEHDLALEQLKGITAFSYGEKEDEQLKQLNLALENFDIDQATGLIDELTKKNQ